MNPELKFTTLGEIGRVAMCKRVLKNQTDEKEEIPFYKISTFGQTPLTFITRELFENFKSKYSYPKKGDILISAAGTIGKTVIFDGRDSYFQDSNIVWIDNDELKVTNQFLYYYYQTKPWIPTNGSTIKRLYNENIRSLVLAYPSLFEQKKITKILSDLDTRIELNNRMNAELESMAKVIYDYWFVQFDFPDENGKPYKSSGGKMVYNEALKRELPIGWEVDEVQNILAKEMLPKKIQSSEYLSSGNFPIIDQSKDFICGYSNDQEKVLVCDVPRIVFGDHTRVLKLINFDFARGADGTQIILSNNPRVPQHFFYHTLLKIDLSNYGYARHFKFLKESKVIIPKQYTSNNFELLVKSFYDQIKLNVGLNRELGELRDWLLPMLMNGQVTIKD